MPKPEKINSICKQRSRPETPSASCSRLIRYLRTASQADTSCPTVPALLEVEQPLRLHPAGIAQAGDVDPRGQRAAAPVAGVPLDPVGAGSLEPIHRAE